MSVNYGSKRIVVGAHYGLRDWLSQRVTAALMALFTLNVLAQVIFSKGPIGYDKWAGIFSSQWMKVLTFSVIVALLWHVWVGMRDVWMDYIKPVGLRLALHLWHRVRAEPEDGRYRYLREHWNGNQRYFWLFFQFQALLIVLFNSAYGGEQATVANIA